ncbi:ribosome-associated protein [Georgenia satyanarayanai]|uniref:Ribosome-associated protein n=1 Tax=Georgenia satyanarayanai TaxID=860221 RepID=A0A2Y9A0M9_9MICO|nr:alternative ribosome rescue aminoacyl-tRNA hydrolase ArfB [Georgenia satyanarayanai]PYG02245.1 ribosome-associated protein [Georgenia satyanarayanai]SSA37088.1 ribosome-associated protein [Georgenia satyanarayanai]
MAGDLRVTSSVALREEELQWRFSRSSGPGGQSVNTTDSRAELTVDLAATPALSEHQRARVLEALAGRLVDGRLTVTASEHRSQLRNREAAAERLAQVLREALAPPPPRRRPTKPSRGAQRRRAEAKTRRSQTKSLRRRPTD